MKLTDDWRRLWLQFVFKHNQADELQVTFNGIATQQNTATNAASFFLSLVAADGCSGLCLQGNLMCRNWCRSVHGDLLGIGLD